MKASDLSKIVLEMKDKMPESSRSLLASKIIKQIGLTLQDDAAMLKVWQDSGAPQKFLADCELNSGPPWVKHDLAVHDTDLANFCNRWMSVERIRIDDGDWEPLTADQNDIRCKMVEDLKAMSDAQLGN